ncbi:hypothetical protein KSP40_PGU010290 [Platanthera guangdongensis]|uniref:Peptidase A1 domain-containing protein n=1 Tax=Platanthera guangdongensis TaxID=2320717 RepID=A0ABR2LDM9_9ASPA
MNTRGSSAENIEREKARGCWTSSYPSGLKAKVQPSLPKGKKKIAGALPAQQVSSRKNKASWLIHSTADSYSPMQQEEKKALEEDSSLLQQEEGESMDHQRPRRAQHPFLLLFLLCFVSFFHFGRASVVFKVQRRYSGRVHTIADLRAHDVRRHGRILSGAVDFPLGGIGLPTSSGLYYTQIGTGTPSKPYYVQVDTGSDILWVNCITCKNCPQKSDIGIDLKLYDLKGSSSGRLVTCEESFCLSTYGGDIPGCVPDASCEYNVLYGDGSSTAGYFVTDYLQYNQVSGNHQTITANTSVSFGKMSYYTSNLKQHHKARATEKQNKRFWYPFNNDSMQGRQQIRRKVGRVYNSAAGSGNRRNKPERNIGSRRPQRADK